MPSEERLVRQAYISKVDSLEREYFVYLPRGYDDDPQKSWPLMLFLHGNGERGNGKNELDYVLKHGPVYEAWIQKRDIPFIIISPQLHMFDFDKAGLDYIDNRSLDSVPKRLTKGVPPRSDAHAKTGLMTGHEGLTDLSEVEPLLPRGWERVEEDLLNILGDVQNNFRTDKKRVVLTGLSYGGFGTWYMASKHPELFSAIVPVVGWGHPSLMEPIAKNQIPVWAFAGGRDQAVQPQYFYAGLNKLESLGHNNVRFTIHEDMPHDAWTRVYASTDIYEWMLQQAL